MSANTIVHINGWPGTGKLTVARLLAPMLGAKLVDNHTLINPAEMLFGRRDPLYRSLRGEIRTLVFDHIARADSAASFIFTDALSDDEYDTRQFEAYRDLAVRRNARLVAVVLDCSEKENLRRLVLPARAERLKLVNPDILSGLRAKHLLLRPKGCALVGLDVTALSADDAAAEIAQRLNGGERLSRTQADGAAEA